ncbi:MAG: membrane protein insertase YidC, partial [Acidobacteriota bacterium]
GDDLYPFSLVFGDRGTALNKALFVAERSQEGSAEVLTFRHSSQAGVAEKVFRLDERGFLDVEVRVDGTGWGVVVGPGIANEKERGGYSQFLDRAVGYKRAGDFETLKADKLEGDEVLAAESLDWVALENNFFLVGLVPGAGVEDVRVRPILQREEIEEQKPRFLPIDTSSSEEDLKAEMLVILEADHSELSFRSYFGSKRYSYLSSLPYGFEETVRWGSFIGVLAKPLYLILGWIYETVVANYGWAIVLVTLLIRLVFFPLTHKSQKSMTKMQELNPKVQAIRNKYRNKLKDKQGRPKPDMQRQMNEEVMAVYSGAGVNPAAGCLPVLLQMPVFFAFYRLLTTSVELRGAEWLGWIQDLSQPDPYTFPLPLLMGATSILVQRMTPAPPDPMQRRLMQLMPIMFTAFAIYFPSGLVVYWTTNNLLTMCQQGLINRMKNRE